MNILAFDCASSILSVALSSNDVTSRIEIDGGLHHGESIIGVSDQLLSKAGLKPSDLDLVACMQGPGSFTGLRIGFAAAKGMALALNIPYLSVPTLDCMAFSHSNWPGTVLPVIDAKKKMLFTALYNNGKRTSDYLELDILEINKRIESLGPALITGNDSFILENLYKENQIQVPHNLTIDKSFYSGYADVLLEKAKGIYIINKKGDTPDSGPLYLRKSDAELKLIQN